MSHSSNNRNRFRILTAAGAALLVAPVLVLWSWNIALPEIAGAPVIDYRNALGLVTLALILGLAAAIPFSARRRVPYSSKGGRP